MTEKRLRELTAGLSQRSSHSVGLQPHEPPNRRLYQRPRTECHAAEPCLLLAGSSNEFGGTHMGATSAFFGGTHVGSFSDFFSGTHFGSTSGIFGGTHSGSTSDMFGGTHFGSTSDQFGGTHVGIGGHTDLVN